MPRFKVRQGSTLPHNGALLTGGSEVDLPSHVAADIAVRWMLEPADPNDRDAVLALMPPAPGATANDFAYVGAAHERVGAIEADLKNAQQRVEQLQRLLDEAKQQQERAVKDAGERAASGGGLPPTSVVGGVPIRMLDHGAGGTTVQAGHGEAIELKPGDALSDQQAAQSQAQQPPTTQATQPAQPAQGPTPTVAQQAPPTDPPKAPPSLADAMQPPKTGDVQR